VATDKKKSKAKTGGQEWKMGQSSLTGQSIPFGGTKGYKKGLRKGQGIGTTHYIRDGEIVVHEGDVKGMHDPFSVRKT